MSNFITKRHICQKNSVPSLCHNSIKTIRDYMLKGDLFGFTGKFLTVVTIFFIGPIPSENYHFVLVKC